MSAALRRSKRKLEEDEDKCTLCSSALSVAYASDGKSRLCNECYTPAQKGFELKILLLDPDLIWTKWVCPQLGACPKDSTAVSVGVGPIHIREFLVLMFSIGRVTDPLQLVRGGLSKVLSSMNIRSGIVLKDITGTNKKVESTQCIRGDITCYLVFRGTRRSISIANFVTSPGSSYTPEVENGARYAFGREGNKNFLVL